jgi:hypothetical protein
MVLPLLYLLIISWKSGPHLLRWDGSVSTQTGQKVNNRRMLTLSNDRWLQPLPPGWQGICKQEQGAVILRPAKWIRKWNIWAVAYQKQCTIPINQHWMTVDV